MTLLPSTVYGIAVINKMKSEIERGEREREKRKHQSQDKELSGIEKLLTFMYLMYEQFFFVLSNKNCLCQETRSKSNIKFRPNAFIPN